MDGLPFKAKKVLIMSTLDTIRQEIGLDDNIDFIIDDCPLDKGDEVDYTLSDVINTGVVYLKMKN